MDSKEVLNGATIVVLMAVLGIIVLAGTILLMMWAQPGIARSPSEKSQLAAPYLKQKLDPLPQYHQNELAWASRRDV